MHTTLAGRNRSLLAACCLLAACGGPTTLSQIPAGELLLDPMFSGGGPVFMQLNFGIEGCPELQEPPRARANGIDLAMKQLGGLKEVCVGGGGGLSHGFSGSSCGIGCVPYIFGGAVPLDALRKDHMIAIEIFDSSKVLTVISGPFGQTVALPSGPLHSTALTLRFDPGPNPYLTLPPGHSPMVVAWPDSMVGGTYPKCVTRQTQDPAELVLACDAFTGPSTVSVLWPTDYTTTCTGLTCARLTGAVTNDVKLTGVTFE